MTKIDISFQIPGIKLFLNISPIEYEKKDTQTQTFQYWLASYLKW